MAAAAPATATATASASTSKSDDVDGNAQYRGMLEALINFTHGGRAIGRQFSRTLNPEPYIDEPTIYSLDVVQRTIRPDCARQKPSDVYASCKACFKQVRSRTTSHKQWQEDATIMEVMLDALWTDRGLPHIPELKKAAGANTKLPPSEPEYRPKYRTILHHLTNYQNRNGRQLGKQFEFLPKGPDDPRPYAPVADQSCLNDIKEELSSVVPTPIEFFTKVWKIFTDWEGHSSPSAIHARDALAMKAAFAKFWHLESLPVTPEMEAAMRTPQHMQASPADAMPTPLPSRPLSATQPIASTSQAPAATNETIPAGQAAQSNAGQAAPAAPISGPADPAAGSTQVGQASFTSATRTEQFQSLTNDPRDAGESSQAGPPNRLASWKEIAQYPQTEQDVSLILEADACMLAWLARSQSIDDLQNVLNIVTGANCMASRRTFFACIRAPASPTEQTSAVEFPGLAKLLSLEFSPHISGISAERDEVRTWPSRYRWAAETVIKILPPDHGFDTTALATFINHLGEFSREFHDRQIHVDIAASRQYLKLACSKLAQKWLHVPDTPIDVEAEAAKAESYRQDRLKFHYAGLRQRAVRLLADSQPNPSEGRIIAARAQISAAAALAAIQVAAVEVALLLVNDSTDQLQSALQTGIGPANILHSVSPSNEIRLPAWTQPELGFKHAPYAGRFDSEAAKPLVAQITANIMAYGRLAPDARDYMIAYGNAALLNGPLDLKVANDLTTLMVFYPRHMGTLLLMANMHTQKERHIVAAYLLAQLAEYEKYDQGSPAEPLSALALALHRLNQPKAALALLEESLKHNPAYFTAVLNYLFVLCGSAPKTGMDQRAHSLFALERCDQIEARFLSMVDPAIETTPLLQLVDRLSLSQLAELQQYYLVKGRLYMNTKNIRGALKSFKNGLEAIIGQPLVGGNNRHLLPTSVVALLEATLFQIRYAWVLQAGEAGRAVLQEAEKRISEQTGGKETLTSISANCLWLLRAYPEIANSDVLPLRTSQGQVPAILLTNEGARKLARRVFSTGRASSFSVIPPVNRALDTLRSMRVQAETEMREATSVIIQAMAGCLEVAVKTGDRDLAEVVLVELGVYPSLGLLLCLYYLAYSLHPTATIAYNIAVLCDSLEQNLTTSVQPSPNGDVFQCTTQQLARLWLSNAKKLDMRNGSQPLISDELHREFNEALKG